MSSAVSPPSEVAPFEREMRAALGESAVDASDLARYAVDGITPLLAVSPSSESELSAVLAAAHSHQLAVIPFGGGTHMSIGNLPASYDVAVSLARMDRIVAYEPADLTLTVEAGARLVDVRRELSAHNQFLPLDPPCGQAATVGGIVAANAYGPLRHAFGTARDWLIGIRVVHADGTVSKAGGRVVKNVTGYEMTKLYTGSLGTLGGISQLTFKLAPIPPHHATVTAAAPTAAACAAMIMSAHDAGLAIYAAELLSPDASRTITGADAWTALWRCAGGEQALARTLHDLRAIAADTGTSLETAGGDTWTSWTRAFTPGILAMRCFLAPTQVADAAAAIADAAAGRARISATVSAGVLRIITADDGTNPAGLHQTATEVARGFGGAAVIDAAPPALKGAFDVFGPTRPDFAIMQRLKDEFDPQRTLSPSRFAGRL